MALKKSLILTQKLLFVYLIVFPLGQLVRVGELGIDVLSLGFLLVFIRGNYKFPRIWKFFLAQEAVFCSSLLFSLAIFKPTEILAGFGYLIRLVANFALFIVVFNFVKKAKKEAIIYNSLILISVFIAIFGFLQYFFYPDLTSLKEFGWDDHLYRLIGTFIDPGFTGILLVLGFILCFTKKVPITKRLLIGSFIFIAILLTYSRASYLALFMGMTFILWKNSKIKIVLFGLTMVLTALLLPRPGGEGVKLERTASINQRLENYSNILEIFKKSPLFGVGYNNLCIAKKYLLNIDQANSHSCSGSDSSLLMILATTGVLGIMATLNLGIKIFKAPKNSYGLAFNSSLAAVCVHSVFVNSLFYPWVLGWLGIILAISLKEKT